MTQYRALVRLGREMRKTIEIGTIDSFKWLPEDKIQKLIRLGKIAKVQPPPLRILPRWAKKAERLAKFGIYNAEELLEANEVDLARKLNLKPATIRKWQREVKDWMKGPSPASG